MFTRRAEPHKWGAVLVTHCTDCGHTDRMFYAAPRFFPDTPGCEICDFNAKQREAESVLAEVDAVINAETQETP